MMHTPNKEQSGLAKPCRSSKYTHDQPTIIVLMLALLYVDRLSVGMEMPISRIVIAVPNTTVVLLD
jgi:hypothetical protein